MTPISLLKAAGEALYGPRWQSDLARDLGVSDRTMRRWAGGADDLPAGVATDLRRLCEARAALLDDVIERIETAATPA
jgi:DNA-binding transcriptional regulator YdaS (Cro superfamily)